MMFRWLTVALEYGAEVVLVRFNPFRPHTHTHTHNGMGQDSEQ